MTSLRAAMLCLSGVLALLFFVKAPPAYAQQVTLVPPFVGTNSETWEEFPIHAIPSGTSILGGIAMISDQNLEIDGPQMFTLCGHGLYAIPSDGTKFLGAAYPSGPLTISFSQPVSAFGAYWGGVPLQCEGSSIILTFRDANGNVVGSDSFNYEGNGTLEWHGYTFAIPVKTITRDTDFRIGTVTDGLQATVASSSTLLGNISTRAFVQTGDNVVIGGLIITGSGQKSVIVLAIGPSLAQHGITNPLQNPTLELHDHTGAAIASNDNWMNASNRQEIINSGLAPSNNLESAILTSLTPGSYTAIVRGVNNGTGVALMEAYDLNPAAGSKLGNISTRALVQTGNNVMIGGFIITGYAQKRVIVRAIGPSLAQHGITNPLLDPTLELHNGNGAVIAFNDNWRDTQEAEIQATGLAPTDNRESAIVRSLTPGNYTAIVRGENNTIGVALVELYELN
ncbi:MAG: hypothetical protein WA183_00295 [Chthoniobacterales bacterium]